MRYKVKASAAVTIARGAGKYKIANRTATAAIFVQVGNNPETGAPQPLATEAEGTEVEAKGVYEVSLGPENSLSAIVKAAGAEQELDVSVVSPRP